MTKIELPESVLEEHLNVTSSLYQPKIPAEFISKGNEISSHLERIKVKLARVEEIERKRNEAHMRKQWEQYELRRSTTLSEYKRPFTTVFLLASGVYISCHAIWWFLEKDKRIEQLHLKQIQLVEELETKLKIQNEISVVNKRSWWNW